MDLLICYTGQHNPKSRTNRVPSEIQGIKGFLLVKVSLFNLKLSNI